MFQLRTLGDPQPANVSCSPGTAWDPSKNSCECISGSWNAEKQVCEGLFDPLLDIFKPGAPIPSLPTTPSTAPPQPPLNTLPVCPTNIGGWCRKWAGGPAAFIGAVQVTTTPTPGTNVNVTMPSPFTTGPLSFFAPGWYKTPLGMLGIVAAAFLGYKYVLPAVMSKRQAA